VKTGGSAARPTLSAGAPEPLFPIVDPTIGDWTVSKDGRRFVLPIPATEADAAAYKIVLNWQAALDK
jgi:hypothetical protein